MLNGESISGNSSDADASYKKGGFLAKTNNGFENKENGLKSEPEGMFRVSDISKRKIILRQIDCDSAHWKGNSKERMIGPNKNCQSRCEYFKKCHIREYVLLLKSGFE